MCKKKKLFKINCKKILKIIIMLLLILILMWAFSKSFADEPEPQPIDPEEIQETVGTQILDFLNGLLGILLWGIVLIPTLLFVIVPYLILSLLFILIGNTQFVVTPADIFYNRIPILSIDFFDFSAGGSDILSLRSAIAQWFVTLSGVSLVILLGVLIYIAIRAVIASTGQSKAKYYKMFVNWLISLGMLALLGIIIVGTISINNSLVRIIEQAATAVTNGLSFSEIILRLIGYSLAPTNFIRQVSSAVILAVITMQTFKYAFIYIKRMIKIAFLVIISPLITITYSIDKIGDNKSQALNTWMHVFIYNVLIQTFHALIFSVFFTMALSITGAEGVDDFIFGDFSSSIPGTIIAIMSLQFIGEGEKIIRQIFSITDGERLPEAGKLVQFGLAKQAIDLTSKKLKSSSEKQGKSRFFEGKSEIPKLPSTIKDSNAGLNMPPREGLPSSIEAPEGIKDQPAGQPNLDMLDKNIKESLGDKAEPTTFRGKAGKLAKDIFVSPIKNLYGKNFVQASAVMGGAILGIASGDLSTAWGLMGSASHIGKMLDQQRESRSEKTGKYSKMNKTDRYSFNTKLAAKEALNAFGLNQMINGESPDINNQEQINKMQSWFRMVGDKADSGSLLKEYEKSRKDLVQKLKAQNGLTQAQATTVAYRLEESLMNGRIPEEGTVLREVLDTEEGRNHASMVMEKKQMQDMEQYNDLESDIKGVTYDYENVERVLTSPDLASAVKDFDPSQSLANSKEKGKRTVQGQVPDQGQVTTQINPDGSQPAGEPRSIDPIQAANANEIRDSTDSVQASSSGSNETEPTKKLQETNKQLEKAEDALKEIEKKQKELLEEFEISKKELDEAEKTNRQDKSKEQEKVENLESQINDLENSKKIPAEEINKLTADRKELEGAIKQMNEEKRIEVLERQSQITTAERKHIELMQALNEVKTQLEEVNKSKNKRGEVKGLESKIAVLNNQIKDSYGQLSDYEKKGIEEYKNYVLEVVEDEYVGSTNSTTED